MTDAISRVAVVTGTSRGIGRATAKLFAQEGWAVVGIDHEEGEPLPGMRFFWGDVAVPKDVDQAFLTVKRQEGRIDVLVNNAAVQLCSPFHETSVAEWDRLMAINVRAPFLATKAALEMFPRTTGGAVVNVGSVHALATSPDLAAYATSKGAVMAMTRALALELAPRNVRVNAVVPGAVNTPMLHAALELERPEDVSPYAHLKEFGKRQPIGRVGRPEEIAQAILFLADGSRSSYVTGQCLVADGGVMARLSV